MMRTGRVTLGISLIAALFFLSAKTPAQAQTTPGAVGLRISVSNTDAAALTADFDLIMYTRGLGPYGTAGRSMLPALDFGDGSTVPYLTLGLTNTGGGPGGSNIYRTLASLTHTYPAPMAIPYRARAGMSCVGCVFSSYVYFPAGGTAPGTFTGNRDQLPTIAVGYLGSPAFNAGTSYVASLMSSVRFVSTYFQAITNQLDVVFTSEIPTVSEWGLIILGASLLAVGVFFIRRGEPF